MSTGIVTATPMGSCIERMTSYKNPVSTFFERHITKTANLLQNNKESIMSFGCLSSERYTISAIQYNMENTCAETTLIETTMNPYLLSSWQLKGSKYGNVLKFESHSSFFNWSVRKTTADGKFITFSTIEEANASVIGEEILSFDWNASCPVTHDKDYETHVKTMSFDVRDKNGDIATYFVLMFAYLDGLKLCGEDCPLCSMTEDDYWDCGSMDNFECDNDYKFTIQVGREWRKFTLTVNKPENNESA